MVPAQAHDDGSSSPGSRIFSTRTYAEPGERGEPVEVLTGVAQPVGVIDPKPVDQADVEPPLDLCVRRVEHLGLLDPDPGQRGHREEPPVVELGVAAPPRDQLVVLLVEGRRRRRHRQPELVVAHLARGDVHLDRALVVVAHDRHQRAGRRPRPSRCRSTTRSGTRGRARARPTTRSPAAARRPRRGWARCRPARPCPACGPHWPAPPARSTHRARGPHACARDVVPVLAAGLRGEQGREVDPVDAEVVEVRQPLRRLEQVELRGELEPVRAPRRASGHGRGSTPVSHVQRWPRPRTRPRRRRPSGRARSGCGMNSRSTSTLFSRIVIVAPARQHLDLVGRAAGVDHDVPRLGVLRGREGDRRLTVGVEVEQEVVVDDGAAAGIHAGDAVTVEVHAQGLAAARPVGVLHRAAVEVEPDDVVEPLGSRRVRCGRSGR